MPAQMPRGRRKTYVSNKSFIILMVLFALIAFSELRTRFSEETDLNKFFEPFKGCMVLRDLGAGKTTRINPELAATRIPPQSTFKVANALIDLDSGVASGPEMVLPWDGRPWPMDVWNRDHTMAQAMTNSTVWYFQEMARRVGPSRMGPYLKALDYGNADISSGVDGFWLGGSLLISADEQVNFLSRLVREDLPIKPQAQAQVKEMLLLEKGEKGVLRGKTGTRLTMQGMFNLGWFVGWIERGGQVQVFALNIQGEGASGPKARQITEDILRELKLW